MMIVGIDPGVSGALCVMNTTVKDLIDFFDTPTLEIKTGKKFKKIIDCGAAALMLETIRPDYLIIEKVQAMPGKPSAVLAATGEKSQSMGATSAFTFGMGFGMWLGIIAALKIPHEQVHPATWKKTLMAGMTKEKDSSRVKALQLFPQTAKNLARKKDHGRADACLLAEYGRRTYFGQQERRPQPPEMNPELPF